MNKKLLLLAAASALGLCVSAYDGAAQTAPTPPPSTIPGGNPHHRHPAIRAAIAALERAKAEMQAAAHDYGGHREEALQACDNAIAQLKEALQYANGTGPGVPGTPSEPTPTP